MFLLLRRERTEVAVNQFAAAGQQPLNQNVGVLFTLPDTFIGLLVSYERAAATLLCANVDNFRVDLGRTCGD